MKVIIVANPKGGTGKSTIAVNLAGILAVHGKVVTLVDRDGQRSSWDWAAQRPEDEAPVNACIDENPHLTLAEDSDFVVVDMPAGMTQAQLADDLKAADIWLIPLTASPVDLRAMHRLLSKRPRIDGLQIGIIANRVNERTVAFKEMGEFFKNVDVPVVARLRETQNYLHAMKHGLTIFELPAAQAFRDWMQWQALLDWIAPGEGINACP